VSDRELRSIPALPDEIGGVPVARWNPWAAEQILSHVDPGCDTCADPGPGCINRGFALTTHRGRQVELYRWHAHRCPACDVLRIYERQTDPDTLRLRSVEVLHGPPRTHPAHLIPSEEPTR